MDKDALLHLASREKSSKRYDQRQADLRNIAILAAFGKNDSRFYDVDNIKDEPNDKFWTALISEITHTRLDDASEYPPLTVYEFTSYVLSRATQLSMGAQSFFGGNFQDLISIAKDEIRNGTADAVIRRRRPNGSNVYLRVNDACGTNPPFLKYFGNHFMTPAVQALPITSSVL